MMKHLFYYTIVAAVTLVAAAYQPERIIASLHASQQAAFLWKDNEYCRATIDYSSANEYIEEQYGHQPVVRKPYFTKAKQRQTPIYNARKGVFDDGAFRPPSLDFCGFEVVQEEEHQAVADWRDLEQIRQSYLPTLRKTIEEKLCSRTNSEKVLDVIFWHPVLRGEEFTCAQQFDKEQAKTSHMAVADVAHIDIDFGAYEDSSGIAELVYKSHIRETDRPPLELQEMKDLLGSGSTTKQNRRFAIVNAWRNVMPQPIQSAPLALMHTHYNNNAKEETNHHRAGSSWRCFPDVAPCPHQSKWYAFPELTPTELLLFYQYDRTLEKCSDLWHQALPEIQEGSGRQRRRSFDVRMLVVFDETLPDHLDRLHPGRTRAKGDDSA